MDEWSWVLMEAEVDCGVAVFWDEGPPPPCKDIEEDVAVIVHDGIPGLGDEEATDAFPLVNLPNEEIRRLGSRKPPKNKK